MRRASIWVLAAFHLLQATWLLQGGIDLLFPRTTVVKPGADSCCTRRCGCPETAQQRKSCCCFPGATAEAPAAAPVPLSTLDELKCAGTEGELALFFHPPTLPLPAVAPLFVPATFRLELPELRPDVPPRDLALDKVPL